MELLRALFSLYVLCFVCFCCFCCGASADSLIDKVRDRKNAVSHEETTATLVRGGVYVFGAFGSEYRLDTRGMNSSLLPKDFTHHFIRHDGSHISEHKEDTTCVLEGYVDHKSRDSSAVRRVFATVTLCRGNFHGHIMTPDFKHISFTGLTAASKEERTRPILVYKPETLNELEHYSFDGLSADEMSPGVVERGVRSRRLASNRIKYIQLLIVNDHERFKTFVEDTQVEAVKAVQYTSFLYAKLNAKYRALRPNDAYSFSISIAGMITFAHGNPWTGLLKRNGKEVDTKNLLELFNGWRETQLSGRQFPAHSAAHLLSGEDFDGNKVGLAYLQRICSNSAATGINQGKGFTHVTLGTIVAHELAHNLGVFHTSQAPPKGLSIQPCSGGIMGPSGITEDDWTACAVEYLSAFFDGAPRFPKIYDTTVVPACLEQRPTFVWALEGECGNGLKEAGEQCDCGADDCGDKDPCCDGSKCTFKSPDFECSAVEPCCTSECKIFDPVVTGQNKVCRAKSSSGCDREEICDGQTAQCPPDRFVEAGTSCTASGNSQGSCYAGSCLSHESQCLEHTTDGATGSCAGFAATAGDKACGDLYCEIGGGLGCQRIPRGTEFVKVNAGTRCNKKGHVCDSSQEKCVPLSELAQSQKSSCSNGALDEGETDVDCGGPVCFPCFPGEKCLKHTDCAFGKAGTDYECADSTFTSTKNLSGSARTDFQRPDEGKCSDFQEKKDCEVWSGCVWIGEYSSIQINKCKNTGWYPSRAGEPNFDDPRTCRNQRKMESCINWIFCDWNWDTSSCEEVDRTIVYGTCTGDQLFKRDVETWYEKVISWINENRILSIGVAIFVGLLLLSCTCSFISRCNRRSHLKRRDREFKQVVDRRSQRSSPTAVTRQAREAPAVPVNQQPVVATAVTQTSSPQTAAVPTNSTPQLGATTSFAALQKPKASTPTNSNAKPKSPAKARGQVAAAARSNKSKSLKKQKAPVAGSPKVVEAKSQSAAVPASAKTSSEVQSSSKAAVVSGKSRTTSTSVAQASQPISNSTSNPTVVEATQAQQTASSSATQTQKQGSRSGLTYL